ncbi:MAG: hypothetical protein JWP20_56 [Roseomonas sp.]|nr:hypothetical protein [Roseomonas sp.]
MSRTPLALLIGFIGLLLYLGAVLWLGDYVQQLHWAVQVPFYVAAGIAWAFPTRALILWAARVRR